MRGVVFCVISDWFTTEFEDLLWGEIQWNTKDVFTIAVNECVAIKK